MIKNDGWILEFAKSGGITPFDPEAVNPASYDISLGAEIKIDNATINLAALADLSTSIPLVPGAKVIAVTREWIKVPNDIAVTVRLKSSLARQMIVSPMGLFVDPGYEGNITFCLINMGNQPYELRFGRRVGQFIFQQMSQPAEIPYGDPRRKSHYQGSRGLTENKSTL